MYEYKKMKWLILFSYWFEYLALCCFDWCYLYLLFFCGNKLNRYTRKTISLIFIQGGMKAVIWTDVLQSVVILVGLLAAIIQGLIVLGGFKRTFSIASQGGRIKFDKYEIENRILFEMTFLVNSVSFDPRTRHTIWSLLIGGTFNSLSTYGFNQTQIQRYMSVRSTRGAKQALFINAIGAIIVILLSSLIGVIIYAYYANCDPYTSNKIQDIDQIFPYFVMEVLSDKKGLPGIFLACIFSGSLSTISSGLNSLAAVLIEDIYKGLMGRQMTDQRQGFISKILSVILGAFVILLTYVVSYFGSILNAALSLFGVLEGPIMGVFFLGFFFPQANRRGALVGFLTSLVFQLWIFLGAQITKHQMIDVRLPFSIANCTDRTNSTLEEMNTNWTMTTIIPIFTK
jgi:SSS family transporter